MDGAHRLSAQEARRVAVRAQGLTADSPVRSPGADVVDVVREVMLVQLDPVSPIAPSADLVMWSRLGSRYRHDDLRDAVDEQRLLQLENNLRVPEDFAAVRGEMADWFAAAEREGLSDWEYAQRDWVRANDGCRHDLLERLRADGPLPLSELPDSCEIAWRSSGWNANKNVPILLGFMVRAGEVAVAGGLGRDKLWDLAERVYPDVEPVPPAQACAVRDARRLRAVGLARSKGQEHPGERVHVHDAGEPAVVEGVRGTWRVDPEVLADVREHFAPRTALLSPLDRLIHERKRMGEVFGFEYVLEMYKPAAKRRWGYYALPILSGDRLIGKLDARLDGGTDPADGALVVHAVHEDEPFTKAARAAVDAEIHDLARWLDVEVVRD